MHGCENPSPAHFGLTLSEQEFHTLLEVLRRRYKLESHSRSVTCTQNTIRVVHRYNADSLTNGLDMQ